MLTEECIDTIVKFIENQTGLKGHYNNVSLRDFVVITIAAIFTYSLVATKGEEKC